MQKTYWSDVSDDGWRDNSHWRDTSLFPDSQLWLSIGRNHFDLFRRLGRMSDSPHPLGRVVEWGCGGGANAVHFAPDADEFVGVDITSESIDECRRQVEAACDTPFTGVLATVDRPEDAVARIGSADTFLRLYVLELVRSPEYGMRVIRIARDLLTEGCLALVQIKYRTRPWNSRSRRRGYRRNVANMTTYALDEFWTGCASLGLRPEVATLVPDNPLDKNYAYLLLSKPA